MQGCVGTLIQSCMGIPFFNSSRRKRDSESDGAGGHSGYFALHDRFEGPDYDEWDARLDAVDRHLDRDQRARQRWWHRSYWRGRGKLWWTVRVIAAMLALFIMLVGWLAITAPLSASRCSRSRRRRSRCSLPTARRSRATARWSMRRSRSLTCPPMSPKPSSRSRIGGSMITGASIRAASRAPRAPTSPAGWSRAAARSPSSSPSSPS